MSTTKFKAAYAINVTDVADINFVDTLKSWNLPIKESAWDDDGRYVELEEPFKIVSDSEATIIQIVLADEEFDGTNFMAFRPEYAQAIIQKLQADHEGLFKYMLSEGRSALYATSYVYDTGTDEPVVI